MIVYFKKKFNIVNYKNSNGNMRNHYTQDGRKILKIRTMDKTKYWQRSETTETFTHCWWTSSVYSHLGKTV